MTTDSPIAAYPLAALQAGMVVNHLRAPRSGVDIVQMVSSLPEVVDVPAMRSAWEQVAARHDALRTAFRWEGVDEPRQEVHAAAPPPLVVLDWTGGGAEMAAERMRAFMAADRTAGFDLRVPPLQRVTLMHVADDDWRMVWTFHHILIDGRAFAMVLREVFALYDAGRRGETVALPERRPFRDFVAWYEGKDFGESEPFWRERMRGLVGPTPLPASFHDPADPSEREGRGLHQRMLPAEPTAALDRLVRENGLTMNNVVQGAWALLLARHAGEDDVVFGATRACRKGTIEGADDVVGLFINTVPVRVQVRPELPLVEWLSELRESWRALFEVEHTPLRLIQRWSDVATNARLFDTQIVFENLPLDVTLQADGGPMARRGFHLYGGTPFPLTGLIFGGRELMIEIENERATIDDATARRLLDHLATLLESMASAGPATTVGELSMLAAPERGVVVERWNDTAVSYPPEATLVSLLAEQVARTPDAVAVVDERTSLTYAALDGRAAALARRLRAAGVGRNVLVGVAAERSIEMVVALLAVMKAGGAYVPLDPDYPAERLAFMLEDAAAPVLLAERRVGGSLPPHSAAVIWLDGVAEEGAGAGEPEQPLEAPGPDDLAYMIFTSGSTGRPKGALNAHRGIVNRLLWMQGEYGLTGADVVLQKTPFSFDVSVWEFFWPLLAGAKLVMARPGGHRDAQYLAETIVAEGVTTLHFVPSMLRAFLSEGAPARCTSLRHVIASGEALPPDLVAAFDRALPGADLHNLYGPTECAVDVTYWACPHGETPGVVPIGRPVANTRVYVLDARGEPTPIGVAGELHIGGVQVGKGYHRRPDLTAEKFVGDLFSTDPGARLYRTGDRARWRPDGTLEYLGRLDFQVKIRGFRIELGEIESTLVGHPHVRESVVVARANATGEQRLVAYVVPEGSDMPSVSALREHIMATLPAHMVPTAFVWLPALPLSSNGKVDRRALPAPELDREALSRPFVAPRTPAERTLADIWAAVLRLDQVGVEDNFFELGGDSLLSVQIVSRAALAGLRVTLTQVLRHPTVAALAAVAESAQVREQQGEVAGPVPLTPVQQWFFEGQRDGAQGGAHHWNQAFLFTTPAEFDSAAFADAVAAVTRQHDSLRLRFEQDGAGWRQRAVAVDDASLVEIVELGAMSSATREAAMADASARLQGSLDPANGPLLRVGVFRFGAAEPGRVLVVVHHLAIDGVSWRVLREDLETGYEQRRAGASIALPARTTPFTRWATQLAAPAVLDAARPELPYWESVGSPESVRLPRDVASDGDDHAEHTETLVVRLDESETRALLSAVPAAYNTQINDLLLAALAESMTGWVGTGELVVNVEGHGREDVVDGADLSRTLGWFTTIFPVRMSLGTTDPATRIRGTKELLRGVPQRGLGYGVLRYLAGAETLRAQTTPDIVFNYLGQFDQVLAGSTLFGFASESTGSWYGARTLRRHLLEVNGLVLDGRLELRWSYSRRAHRHETIERVANAYVAALRTLIAHCTTAGVGGYTPSDFPLARIDQATLDRLTAGRRDVEAIHPLIPMQRLFAGFADPATDPGFEQWRYRLRGPLDAAALRAAWELVTARHDILRTAFVSEGLAEPLAIVRRGVTLPWAEHDWRDVSAEEQGRRLTALLHVDRAAGFAFDRAPLMRLTLVRLTDDEHEIVWSNHHLLLDRWSWPLVLLEIAQAYPALATGRRPELASAPRYADFVAWQQVQSLDAAREFWSRHFAGFEAPPRLALVHPDAVPDHAGDEVAVELTAAESAALQAFARARHVAPNAVIEGAWALALARRSTHGDVSFGVTVAGRDGAVPGIERMVGLTTNNLPLRVRVEGEAPLGTWLAALHDAQAEQQQFAHTPLERVQEWSGVPWRTRLFETLLVFQHDDAEASTASWLGAGMETSLVHVPTRTAYPLSVMIAGGERLELRATFDPRYFTAESARELVDGLRRAIVAMTASPFTEAPSTVADVLAELPTSTVGEASADVRAPYVAPRTALEAVVASVWGEVLGAEQVGVNDDFFALGGYSLVATQIVSRLRATLQLEVPVRLLFQAPSVARLATALTARERKPGQLERIAQVVQRVRSMSLDELRRAGSARATTN